MSAGAGVNRGFIPREKPIPSPELSFFRQLADASIGWQLRGQYAIWMGTSSRDGSKYRLLERRGNRVAPIEYKDGSAVFRNVGAEVAFTIENLMGFWLALDCQPIWLDVASAEGRYAVLAIGGATGKPSRAVVDWTCPRCGSSISPREYSISPHGFTHFLNEAEARAAQFNQSAELRTCGNCSAVHPPTEGLRVKAEPNPTAPPAVKS